MSRRRVMDELEEELYGSDESEAKPPTTALDALVTTVDRRALLQKLKGDAAACRRLFQGFKVSAAALDKSLVRSRLADVLAAPGELPDELLKLWREHAPELCAHVEGLSVDALREGLPELVTEWGGGAVWLTLAGDSRKTAQRLLRARGTDWLQAPPPSEPEPKPVAPPEPPPPPPRAETAATEELAALRQRNAELATQVTRHKNGEARARREVERWQEKCEALSAELTATAERVADLENRVERLRRQRQRLETQVEELERTARRLRRTQVPRWSGEETPTVEVVTPPPSGHPRVKAAKARVPGLVWKEGSQRHSIPLTEVVRAVHTNNVSLVREWSRSLRSLSRRDRDSFDRLYALLAEECEYSAHVLTRNTRGVVVDGSNVCHFEKNRAGKAKLANLLAARDELRHRRFFPILIYLDASLPYQIDERERLVELVDRGEARMVLAGTSADDEITRVAREHGYSVVTNDRGLTDAIDPELDLPLITYSVEQGYFYCQEG